MKASKYSQSNGSLTGSSKLCIAGIYILINGGKSFYVLNLAVKVDIEKKGGKQQLISRLKKLSGLAAHFSHPPADAHQKETPVTEELRRFVLKSVSDELQDPAQYKQT